MQPCFTSIVSNGGSLRIVFKFYFINWLTKYYLFNFFIISVGIVIVNNSVFIRVQNRKAIRRICVDSSWMTRCYCRAIINILQSLSKLFVAICIMGTILVTFLSVLSWMSLSKGRLINSAEIQSCFIIIILNLVKHSPITSSSEVFQ